MHAMTRFRTITLLVAAPLSGCFLDTGACNYEHRTLVLRGTISGPVGVEVSLNETRGANPDFRTLNLYLTSGQLTGSVVSAQLRDASTEPAQVLAEWTTGSAGGQLWGANLDLPTASPSHEMLGSLARAGALQVVVQTASAGVRTDLAGTVSVVTDGGWNHPRCD
jgi:hypothetical protein